VLATISKGDAKVLLIKLKVGQGMIVSQSSFKHQSVAKAGFNQSHQAYRSLKDYHQRTFRMRYLSSSATVISIFIVLTASK